mmetsp:Transcript_46398/g.124673  ORF Transcript_46398/g.124673 Transcript_46398/m.124673 type:complete len:264 (-) Transcript_46398:58-849(-)
MLHRSWQVRQQVREGVGVAARVHRREGVRGHVGGEVAVRVQCHRVLEVPKHRLQEDGTASEAAHPSVAKRPLHLPEHGEARWVFGDHVRDVEVVVHIRKPDAVLRCQDYLPAMVLREPVVEDHDRVVESLVEALPEARKRVPDISNIIWIIRREVVQHASEVPHGVQGTRIGLLAERPTVRREALAEAAHAAPPPARLQEVPHPRDLSRLLHGPLLEEIPAPRRRLRGLAGRRPVGGVLCRRGARPATFALLAERLAVAVRVP